MTLVAEERVDLDAPGNRDLAGSEIKGPNGNPDGAPPKHSENDGLRFMLTEHPVFDSKFAVACAAKRKGPGVGIRSLLCLATFATGQRLLR
jgi:hypothetical protein